MAEIETLTIDQWRAKRGVWYRDYCGVGRFMNGDIPLDGDLFGEIPPAATHVEWFNRWRNVHPQTMPEIPAEITERFKSPAK
jgi:hypothetical protein